MSTIVTDIPTIERLVRQAVAEAVDRTLPGLVRRATSKRVLTKSELKAETGWSDRRIQYLRDTKQIAFIPHGRSFLFPREGLDAFYERNRIRVQDGSDAGSDR